MNADDRYIESPLGQYYFMFGCKQGDYPPNLPQLSYEIFPHVEYQAEQENLINIFEVLDEGSWSSFTINHVTHKLLLQAGLCEDDKSRLTILTDEPVEVQEIKEEFVCSDC